MAITTDRSPYNLSRRCSSTALLWRTTDGDYVLKHVGVEPSGDAFNSIVFDERNNRPYNPMVNAGALVTTDLVRGKDSAEKFERILGTLRTYAGNQSLAVDEDTFEAEMRTADRNRATGYLMRSHGMISGDVEGILALYLRQCSVQVTCRDLAVMAATLANGGVNPLTGERALPLRHVREVLSVMHTCGMYDAAGQWAFDVGVPAKSGVSGGIHGRRPRQREASVSTRRGSMRTVTASAASECARRSPSASGYTSLPPKPKTPCSALWSLVKSLFGKGEG